MKHTKMACRARGYVTNHKRTNEVHDAAGTFSVDLVTGDGVKLSVYTNDDEQGRALFSAVIVDRATFKRNLRELLATLDEEERNAELPVDVITARGTTRVSDGTNHDVITGKGKTVRVFVPGAGPVEIPASQHRGR